MTSVWWVSEGRLYIGVVQFVRCQTQLRSTRRCISGSVCRPSEISRVMVLIARLRLRITRRRRNFTKHNNLKISHTIADDLSKAAEAASGFAPARGMPAACLPKSLTSRLAKETRVGVPGGRLWDEDSWLR